jgi:hypothetical protein
VLRVPDSYGPDVSIPELICKRSNLNITFRSHACASGLVALLRFGVTGHCAARLAASEVLSVSSEYSGIPSRTRLPRRGPTGQPLLAGAYRCRVSSSEARRSARRNMASGPSSACCMEN